MTANIPTVDPITFRMWPRNAPLHDSLDGTTGHPLPATGQPAGRILQTNGDGSWEFIPTPTVDPYTAAGSILTATKVNPTTAADYQVTNSAADYNAPTLAVAFTAPATGRVLVDLDATHLGSSAAVMYWLLRQSGVIVPGSVVAVDGTTIAARRHATLLIESLTPGSSYSWTWGGQTLAGGVTSTLRVGGGNTPTAGVGGAAVMVVRDAP